MVADIYQKLDLGRREVRLITLLPGKYEDPISGALSVVSLAEAPTYEALSYVWGDPTVTLPIRVDGLDFQVTTNLEAALRHLRYRDGRNRTLWVDAICINQDDIEERSGQVQQMGDIYGKAQEVVVWLGPKDERLAKAIDQILELGPASHLSSMPKYQRCDHNRYNNQGHVEQVFDPLRGFIDSAWFHRLWVIQEIALAGTARLHCGDRSMAWGDFSMFTAWLRRHTDCCTAQLPPSDSHTMTICRLRTEKLDMIRSHFAAHGPTLDLSLVSDMLRNQHCTDNRDRVYGFLGLIDKPVIRADYGISVPNLYRQTALALIAHTGTLDVLTKAGRSKNYHTLPSWVPDWSAHVHFERANFEYHLAPALNHAQFSACGNSHAEVADLGEEGLLVKGRHVDTVWKTLPVSEWAATTADHGTDLTMSEEQILLWEKMIRLDEDPDRPYPGGGTLTNAYWRTLLADTIIDGPSGSARRLKPEDFDDYLVWREYLKEGKRPQRASPYHPSNNTPEGKRLFEGLQRFLSGMMRALGDRHLFITTAGYIGVACSEIYTGDFVCVLFGGKQPFVLRRGQTYLREVRGEPYTRFEFFGAAYVCGIMDGEAMGDVNGGNTLDFILR